MPLRLLSAMGIVALGLLTVHLVTLGVFSSIVAAGVVGTVLLGLLPILRDSEPASDIPERLAGPPQPKGPAADQQRFPVPFAPVARIPSLKGSTPSIVVPCSVVKAVLDEVKRHRQQGGTEEIGWLVIGRKTAGRITLTGLIPAGPGGHASGSHVAFDPGYQSVAFQLMCCNNPDLEPLGVIHLHPGKMTRPSGGDFQGDSQWVRKLSGQLGVFVIITCWPEQEDCQYSRLDDHALIFNGLRADFYILRADARAYCEVKPELALAATEETQLEPELAQLAARYAPEICRLQEKVPTVSLGQETGDGHPVIAVVARHPRSDKVAYALLSAQGVNYYLEEDGHRQMVSVATPERIEHNLMTALDLLSAEGAPRGNGVVVSASTIS
jgi:hypothetical protein